MLKPIAWSDAFLMGEPEVDRQHRRFIDQVNALAAAADGAADPAPVRDLAVTIADEAREHFAYEETVFARIGLPDAAEHAAEHRRLETRLDALVGSLHAGAAPVGATIRVAAAIRNLLLDHLLYYDLRYKSLLMHQRGR